MDANPELSEQGYRRGRRIHLGSREPFPDWPTLRLHFWGWGRDRLLDVQFWRGNRWAKLRRYAVGGIHERFVLWPHPRRVRMEKSEW